MPFITLVTGKEASQVKRCLVFNVQGLRMRTNSKIKQNQITCDAMRKCAFEHQD